MKIGTAIARKVAKTEFARCALEERADLSMFTQKPGPRVIFGIFLMGFSYILGWPMVGLLGFIAFKTGKPLIAVIGGPATYGLSHLVFMAGAYCAGARYTIIFFRWATRMFLEKYLSGIQATAGFNEKN